MRQLAFENCREGQLKEGYSCNEEKGIWSFEFLPLEPKEGCAVSCDVNIGSGGVEMNWHCQD